MSAIRIAHLYEGQQICPRQETWVKLTVISVDRGRTLNTAVVAWTDPHGEEHQWTLVDDPVAYEQTLEQIKREAIEACA